MLSKEGILPDPNKIQAIRQLQTPSNKTSYNECYLGMENR